MGKKGNIIALHSAETKKKAAKKVHQVERPDKKQLTEARTALDIIDDIDRLVSKKQKRIEKIQKGQNPKAKARTKKTYAVCFGILGFCLGVALSLSEILIHVGPLDTFLKGIASFAIVLLSGCIIGPIFAWAGKVSAQALLDGRAAKARDLQVEIEDHEQERVEEIGQAIKELTEAKNIGIKSRYGK